MSIDDISRRSVLKRLGVTAGAGAVLSGVASAQTLDYPKVYVTSQVAQRYDMGDVMLPVGSLLLDALPSSAGNNVRYAQETPDVSSASSLAEAHSQFENFLQSADFPSNQTNVLIVREERFNGLFEANERNAITVPGAKQISEYYQEDGRPDRYGDSAAHKSFYDLLSGVAKTYKCKWGMGVTYEITDSSVSDDYVRTPMSEYGTSNEWSTNDCGDRTYVTGSVGYDLRYSDCTLATINENA